LVAWIALMGYDIDFNLVFLKLRIPIFCSYILGWRVIHHILCKMKRKRVQDQLNISSYLAAQNAVDRTGHWTFHLAAVTFLDLGLIQNTGQQRYTVIEWHSEWICLLLLLLGRTFDITAAFYTRSFCIGSSSCPFHDQKCSNEPKLQ